MLLRFIAALRLTHRVQAHLLAANSFLKAFLDDIAAVCCDAGVQHLCGKGAPGDVAALVLDGDRVGTG